MGKPLSPEHRAAVSAANKRRWADPEYRARMAPIQRERLMSPEHREKVRAGSIAKWQDPEFRAAKVAQIQKLNQCEDQRAKRIERLVRYNNSRKGTAAPRQKVERKTIEDWCPPDLIRDYVRWRAEFGAAEARRIIEQDIEKRNRRAA